MAEEARPAARPAPEEARPAPEEDKPAPEEARPAARAARAKTIARTATRLPPLALLAAATLVLAGATTANAVPKPDATSSATASVTVSPGDDGIFVPGRPAPVRVSVQSPVLVSGQLVVTSGSYQQVEPVEIPGGSNKTFEVVVPTTAGDNTLAVGVAFTERGVTLGGSAATITASPDTEVVGVLPDLLVAQALPGPVPLAIDAGSARFVALSDQDLASAPGSFGPLSAVATGADGLAQLSPASLQSVLGWTAGGGDLLIDALPGDTVIGLPSAWQSTGQTRVTAGIGQIVFTSGAMAAGQWNGLVTPTNHAVGVPNANQFQGDVLGSTMAGDAGVRTPRLPWLVAFLLLYIVLVGPVAFVLLRRRRRPELLWIVIPLVSVVFAASGYAVSSGSRSRKLVQETILDTTAPGGTDLTYVGVVAGQGTARVDAPSEWVLSRYTSPGSAPTTAVDFKAQVTGRGIEAGLGLDTGQFAVVEGSGPAGFTGRLVVAATATGDAVSGDVVNQTPYPLHDVTVLVGNDGIDIGTLAAGARGHFQVTASTTTEVSIEEQLWGGQSGQNGLVFPAGAPCVFVKGAVGGFVNQPQVCGVSGVGVGASAIASSSVWAAGPTGLATGTRATGIAVAVGWTHDYRPPVTVAGHGRVSQGRTAIVGTAVVMPPSTTPSAPPTNPFLLQRQVVRGDLQQLGPGAFVNTTNSGEQPVVAWQLPGAATGHELTLSVPAGAGEADVWTEGAWHKVAEASGSQGGNQGGFVVPLSPSGAIAPSVPAIPATAVPSVGTSGPATTVNPPSVGAGGVPTTLNLPSGGAGGVPTTPPPAPASVGPAITVAPSGIGVGASSGGGATAVLGPSDVDNGVVYVRLGAQASGQPFDLDALTLMVNP